MNKKKKIIPKLRFPEFKNEGEWQEKALGSLGQFLGGGTPERSNNSYWIGNIPWISSSDVNENDIHNISITRFVNDNAIKQSATKRIPKGSVLFVSRVGVGKLAINKEELCTSQDFTSFVPNKGLLNYFIGYYFSSNKNLLQSLNQGTSIKGFSKIDLENLKLPYPRNAKEQQKIACCLSSLDEVIAAHSQKLELLKEHKKGLVQNLFPQGGEKVPKYRFKEFKDDGMWEKKKLGEIAEFINGRAYKQEELLSKGKYRVLRVGNFFTNNEWYFSDLELEEDKYCEKGDLLYAWSASFGPRMWNEEKVIYHYHIWKVRNKSGINRQFLYHLLDFETFKMKSKSLNGFALMHITKGSIESWESYIPKSEKEQQKIASCLSTLDALTTAQAEKLEQLKQYKRGLMQGLFPKIND